MSEISILIVDDSRSIRAALEAMLRDLGVSDITLAVNGEEALEIIHGNTVPFDAMFVDLHMDGIDGLELMKMLSDLHYKGGVVIMSSLEQKIIEFTQEIVRGMALHLLGSLSKPFEKTLVAFMVKRIGNAIPVKVSPEKLMKVSELTEALERDYVLPYYQPKVNFRTGELVGLETLIRLDMPKAGLITPDKFLPVAEQFEMMDQITEAMLLHTGRDFAEFSPGLGQDTTLAINISPFELLDNKLPQRLKKVFAGNSLDPEQVVIEITENSPLRSEIQLKNFNRLRIQGFCLSLDDYGAGFTNLYQLKSLPFNEIKIDRAMCHGIHQDKVLQIIVESTRRVCDELGLRLVAEGVSDPVDFQMLDRLGIDVVQGFLFCRPKTIQEVSRWYKLWRKTFQPLTPGQISARVMNHINR